MPGPALSLNSPLSIWGIPQANSTTSSPRWMSPLEAAMVLPCWEERSRARLSISFCASSRNLKSTRARRWGLVAAHAGCAACAFATAFPTSAVLANATLAWTSPVFGSNTSPLRPEVPATDLPPIKWPISRMMFLLSVRPLVHGGPLQLLLQYRSLQSDAKRGHSLLSLQRSRFRGSNLFSSGELVVSGESNARHLDHPRCHASLSGLLHNRRVRYEDFAVRADRSLGAELASTADA